MIIIVLLACFWIYLAYNAFSQGDTGKAGIYLLIGAALTAWRLLRIRARR